MLRPFQQFAAAGPPHTRLNMERRPRRRFRRPAVSHQASLGRNAMLGVCLKHSKYGVHNGEQVPELILRELGPVLFPLR